MLIVIFVIKYFGFDKKKGKTKEGKEKNSDN